jgi:hypothetical protein
MFEQMFKKGKTQASNEQENTAQVVPAETGNTILFLYDEGDQDLWLDLAPHINTLVVRLPDVLVWKYYRYPVQRRNERHSETFVADLQKAFLFVPCTSATFLTRFLITRQKDAHLASLSGQTATQPIPLRAAHGVTQSILDKPLAAYLRGAERDAACVRIVAALEEKLLSYLRMRGNTDEGAGLVETNSPLMLSASKHRSMP